MSSASSEVKPKLALIMPKPDPLSAPWGPSPTLMNSPDMCSPIWPSPQSLTFSLEGFPGFSNQLQNHRMSLSRPNSAGFEVRRSSLLESSVNEKNDLQANMPGGLVPSFSAQNSDSVRHLGENSTNISQESSVLHSQDLSQQQFIVPPVWAQPNVHSNWIRYGHTVSKPKTPTKQDAPKYSAPPRRLPPFQKPKESAGGMTIEDEEKQRTRKDLQNRLKMRMEKRKKEEDSCADDSDRSCSNEVKHGEADKIKPNPSPKGKAKRLERDSSEPNTKRSKTAKTLIIKETDLPVQIPHSIQRNNSQEPQNISARPRPVFIPPAITNQFFPIYQSFPPHQFAQQRYQPQFLYSNAVTAANFSETNHPVPVFGREPIRRTSMTLSLFPSSFSTSTFPANTLPDHLNTHIFSEQVKNSKILEISQNSEESKESTSAKPHAYPNPQLQSVDSSIHGAVTEQKNVWNRQPLTVPIYFPGESSTISPVSIGTNTDSSIIENSPPSDGVQLISPTFFTIPFLCSFEGLGRDEFFSEEDRNKESNLDESSLWASLGTDNINCVESINPETEKHSE